MIFMAAAIAPDSLRYAIVGNRRPPGAYGMPFDQMASS